MLVRELKDALKTDPRLFDDEEEAYDAREWTQSVYPDENVYVACVDFGPDNTTSLLDILWKWTHAYGEALCPGSHPDTFGEGMREAKEQVEGLIQKSRKDGGR